jgi:signal transduction histidine kinase
LTVANHGSPIPAQIVKLLFQPFYRLTDQQGHKGLGLGLYIVSEIARAHGGTLSVVSDHHETRFTVRLPRRG